MTGLAILHANLIKYGFARAVDDLKTPHPRIASAWDMLENAQPGAHAAIFAGRIPAQITKLFNLYKQRHIDIVQEEADPLRYGWRVPASYVVDVEINRIQGKPKTIPVILCLGGNRASKSRDAARRVIELMVNKPGARVAILCPSESQAREVAMEYLWTFFPPEWKNEGTGKQKHGAQGSYSYNKKTGFTDGKFTLPNGSMCIFKYYVDGDVKNWEGGQYDMVWADEEVTQDWVDAAVIRLATLCGTLLITFTPISGMTPVVSSIQSLCDVVETRDGGGIRLPKKGLGRMPVLERSEDKSIVYFWPEDNPYGGYETLENLAVSNKWPLSLIKCRLYGIAAKVKDAAFPTFGFESHSWEPDQRLFDAIKEDLKKGVKPTWIHVVDPCHGRPFFMTWWLVLPGIGDKSQARCVREWPQEGDDIPGWGDPGEWALPSKDGALKDGMKGPAQEKQGHTIEFLHSEMDRVEAELAKEFEGAEGDEMIMPYVRLMDSRAGATTSIGAVVNEDLMSAFYKPRSDGKLGRDFEGASGKNINESSHRSGDGIHLINDWLGYKTDELISPLNQPRMLIHKRCKAMLWALKNFTGSDGPTGACKDPVDNAHYFVREDPQVQGGFEWIVDTGRNYGKAA